MTDSKNCLAGIEDIPGDKLGTFFAILGKKIMGVSFVILWRIVMETSFSVFWKMAKDKVVVSRSPDAVVDSNVLKSWDKNQKRR